MSSNTNNFTGVKDAIVYFNGHNHITSSPNRKIEYIVIHYTAGVTSVPGSAKNTAQYFATSNVEASADFIVDDATMVQYNPDLDNYYTWHCGGGKLNTKGGDFNGKCLNKNSIGIEVCSTNATRKMTTPNDKNYSFTPKVITQTVQLVKYLMAKYGIDSNHVLRHYDVTGKLCPGVKGWNIESGSVTNWSAFKRRISTKTSTVTTQPVKTTTTSTTTTKPVTVTVTTPAKTPTNSGSNEKKIWDFLYGKLGNSYAVAGVMGNLYAESGLSPINLQNSYERILMMTDATYTSSVDNGSYTNFVKDSAGYGLAQWTYYSRKQKLLDYTKSKKKSIGDLQCQLEFLWTEFEGYKLVDSLKSAKSVKAASDLILLKFEKPADQSSSMKNKRAQFGQVYFDKYNKNSKKTTTSSTTKKTETQEVPFTVKITSDDVAIRRGASSVYAKVGTTGTGVFTITEVKKRWGKLKSGKGWINLNDVK